MSATHRRGAPGGASAPTLLVVDDEQVILNVLRDVAERVGFNVVTCASGGGALDHLREHHADIAAVDLRMPDIGGLDVLRAIREDGLLTRYVDHVQRFLRGQMVLVVSAAPSRVSLGPGMSLSAWVTWQAKLAGLDLERAEFVPLVRNGAKTTCGAFVSSDNGAPKGLVLMMGGNHLPGEERLGILAEALRRSTGHAG